MPKLKYNLYYTREELEEVVKQNVSIVGTMETLKAPMTSGTLRKKLTKLIQDYRIDTSHFLGMGWNKGIGINHKGRTYYRKNCERQRYLSNLRRKRYVEERMALVNKFKNNPCVDCGRVYPPWVMDFDHREGTIKRATISQAAHANGLWKIEQIMIELEKCDLVCSNCHRNRTYLRIQKNKNAAVTKAVTVIA